MFILLAGAVLVLVIVWFKHSLSYWEKRGIPGPKPWPIVGNIWENLSGQTTLGAILRDIYKKYEGYPFVGIYRGMTPVLLIRDPELVNNVLIKDFKSFRNNEFTLDKETDPLFGRNPFILKNEEWREVRHMLTPGMTSGKMKHIYPILQGVSKDLIKFIENHPTAVTDGIESRGLAKRLTLDYVAKTAFGIDGKAFESYDNISEFNKIANQFLTPGNFFSFFFSMGMVFPILTKLMCFKFVARTVETKLMDMVADVVQYRKQHNITAKDYLQFLIELAKEKNFGVSEITSHACTFFLDGYETSSLALSVVLLGLAKHAQYQEKIREEIKKYEKENNGELTYEAVHEMPWLNACFYEAFRVMPGIDILVKVCNENYEYTPTNEKFKKLTVKLTPGDVVAVPYGYTCTDEAYFQNADTFIPERMFQRDSFEKGTYIPFSEGPRMCIGQRFGVMEVKLATASILKYFELSISPKLKQPIKYVPYHFINEIEGGVWLRYKKIKG